MAIGVSEKVAEIVSTSNATSYAFGSFTPTNNTVLVCLVLARGTVAGGSITRTSGTALTWTKKTSAAFNAGADTVYLFYAKVPATGAMAASVYNFDCTGDAGTGVIAYMFEFTDADVDIADPIVQAKANSGTSTNPTTGAISAENTLNGYCAAWMGALSSSNPANVSAPPTGWTEIGDNGFATPTSNGSGAFRAGGETATSVTFTAASTTWGLIYGEILRAILPDAPTIGATTRIGSTVLTANWTAPAAGSTVTGYKLDIATDSGFTAFVTGYNGLDVGLVLSKDVSGLSAGTPYWIRVRSYNSKGESTSSGSANPTTATSFTPWDIAGLLFYFRADGIIGLVDGDPVTTWSDESGNGNDVTQATAGNKPTYKTNITPTGKSIVRFDGTTDFLATPGTKAFPTTQSLFVVIKRGAGTGTALVLDAHQNGANDAIFQYRYESDTSFGHIGFNNSGGNGSDTQPITAASWNVVNGIRRLTEVQVYVGNSSNGATAVAGTSNSGVQKLGVGCFDANVSPSLFFDGDIAAIVIYNSALSDADKTSVYNFLNTTYLTLPSPPPKPRVVSRAVARASVY